MPDEPLRLSKVVAARVPCSRREAELYITGGLVRVDGQRVQEPQFRVTPSQRVEIEPRSRLQLATPLTLVLHKPAGASTDDARALLTEGHIAGLAALLPLPADASGMCVFSQD